MRLMIPAILALSFAAPLAWADGPITTASPTSSAPAPDASPPASVESADAADQDAGPDVRLGPCGPTKVTSDGKPDRSVHGEVDAGVGTNGYRHVGLSACKPIGDNGAVAISVSQTQFDGGRRR
jgi:hypothetical protein